MGRRYGGGRARSLPDDITKKKDGVVEHIIGDGTFLSGKISIYTIITLGNKCIALVLAFDLLKDVFSSVTAILFDHQVALT